MTQPRNAVHEDLGGGKFKATIGLCPVQYDKGAGWRDITSIISASADPNLTLGVDELIQFRIRPKLSGNAPVWHFGRGNTMVRMTPLNTANVDGIVTGNKISFPGAWPGTEGLSYEIGGHIIRKRIPLLMGHPASFAFRINDHAGLNFDTLETADFRILQPFLAKGIETIPLTWQKTTLEGKLILTVQLPVGNFAGWELDPTLTLQPDATDGIDNLLHSINTTTNYGTLDTLAIGENNTGPLLVWRTLIKFSLTALPENSVISSATLSLCATLDRSSNARTFRVYRQKRAWVETQSTWDIYSTGNNWSTAGGFHVDDCEQTDIGSRAFTATETLNEFKDFTLTPTTKAALDLGNGWLLKADTEVDDGYYFASSDHATASLRPKLVVVYSLPGGGLLNPTFAGAFRGPFG